VNSVLLGECKMSWWWLTKSGDNHTRCVVSVLVASDPTRRGYLSVLLRIPTAPYIFHGVEFCNRLNNVKRHSPKCSGSLEAWRRRCTVFTGPLCTYTVCLENACNKNISD